MIQMICQILHKSVSAYKDVRMQFYIRHFFNGSKFPHLTFYNKHEYFYTTVLSKPNGESEALSKMEDLFCLFQLDKIMKRSLLFISIYKYIF